MNYSAETLCERAARGDADAASELLAGHYRPIFAYFRRLSGSEPDAADLTQKAFAKAWQSLPSFQRRSAFSTWLHAIAHHVYVDWRRRHRPNDSPPDRWWEACPGPEPSPFDAASEADLARQLYRHVDQLDEEKKQTIHLHYYQHLSIRETAEVLGVATSTVKYRLREALEVLRSRMGEIITKGCSHE